MLSTTRSAGLIGIDAAVVDVEVDTVRGLPALSIVGLPDTAIRESKDRIRSAIENSGFSFPPMNFVVNLAPACFKKQGSAFDAAIAVAILCATGQSTHASAPFPLIGELSLDGALRPVRGILSMTLALCRAGFKGVVVPWENRFEAAALGVIDVFAARNLCEALSFACAGTTPFRTPEETFAHESYPFDFSMVLGQETVRRAVEIAAAGHHNILLYGPPGAGKSMIAKCVPSILPELGREESIETTMIHSVGGTLPAGAGLMRVPPFRTPHHTASGVSLVGGGRVPSVGEISLAHHGVLFMDEFAEFRTDTLQALRQPLEDQVVTVSRAAGCARFPADFMLIGSSNPCRCGYLLDRETKCRCTQSEVRAYFRKITGPVLDRIDIDIYVPRVEYGALLKGGSSESSSSIRERVVAARGIQRKRFGGRLSPCNSRMTSEEVRRFCAIDAATERAVEEAVVKLNLSARSFFRVLKVARTIADLDGCERVELRHAMEAVSYKSLQRHCGE